QNQETIASHIGQICSVIEMIIFQWIRRYKSQLSWYIRGVEAEIGRLQLDGSQVYVLQLMQRCLDDIRHQDMAVRKLKESNENAKCNSRGLILQNPVTKMLF